MISIPQDTRARAQDAKGSGNRAERGNGRKERERMEKKNEEKPMIVFSDEQWARLRPMRESWEAPVPRMKEIAAEVKRLESEMRMLRATGEFWKGNFWAEVSSMFPDTADQGMRYEDDPPRLEICFHDESEIEIEGMEGLPPHLKSILGKFFRGI